MDTVIKQYPLNDSVIARSIAILQHTKGRNLLDPIAGQNRKCHHYRLYNNDVVIIEGLGYDGHLGYPLLYFEFQLTGLQVGYGLSHVIENGQIAYKGVWYDPDIHVGIDEAVTDQPRRPYDPNYYNLMGQPVGKDVPTTPGIYIHNGKKIVVR